MKLIVIDPGHGGKDPGASGFRIQEKDVVLKLSHTIKEELIANYCVEVRMTRETDVTVDLSQRTALANQLNADYFISIHNNSFNGQAHGFESYIWNGNVDQFTIDAQILTHNEVMNFLRSYGTYDRGMKRADFYVIRETFMPAILLENLFIDNENENKLLKDDNFLRGLAKAITKGLAKALNLQNKFLYKVQVGAFTNKENAERLAEKLKNKGYQVYIVQEARC